MILHICMHTTLVLLSFMGTTIPRMHVYMTNDCYLACVLDTSLLATGFRGLGIMEIILHCMCVYKLRSDEHMLSSYKDSLYCIYVFQLA